MFGIVRPVRLRGLGFALATILAASLLAPAGAAPQDIADVRPNAERVQILSSGTDELSRVAARPSTRGAQSASFRVTYSGFDAYPEARAAFQYAVNIWGSQITSSVPITVDASFAPLGQNVLGAAGAGYTATSGGRRYPAPLASKLAGRDLAPSWAMIEAQLSSSANWYYGTDGNTPPGKSDFVSVVLHELGHGLGFAGSGDVNGLVGSVSSPPEVYDVNVVDSAGLSVLSIANSSVTLGALFRSGNLYWNGASGMANNGGARPKLYAPSSWSGGSSYSHLDESTYGTGNANSLMTPAISRGESIHDPGPIARGMLQDIGWTIDAGGSATATSTATAPTATPTRTPSPTPTALSLPIPTLPARTQRSYLPTSLRSTP